MCIKLLSKTLNPKAKEWRPTPKHPHPPPPPPPPPHQLLPPPLHPAACNPTPPYYYPNPSPAYTAAGFIHYNVHTQCLPFYNVSFLAHVEIINSCKAALMAAKSSFEGEETIPKDFTEEYKMGGPRVKSPKCPPVDHVFKQGYKRAYPPRIKNHIGRLIADSSNNSTPQTSKHEWRPKKSGKSDCRFSGDGAAAYSPPPRSSGDCRIVRSKTTTVMIKNIPNQLRRDFMLKFLDDYCKTYLLEYDFLYLPIDFRKKGNLGYAFVNFTTSVAAIKFKKILHNFKWGVVYTQGRVFNSNKICEVTWARIQGQKALIERFRKSSFACDRLDFLPVIFDPPRNGSDLNPSPPVILGSLDRTV